jgi:hypothetical protein
MRMMQGHNDFDIANKKPLYTAMTWVCVPVLSSPDHLLNFREVTHSTCRGLISFQKPMGFVCPRFETESIKKSSRLIHTGG